MSVSVNSASPPSSGPVALRDVLEPGEDRLLTRIVIDKAKAGDSGALRFVVGRLHPRPRGRAITRDLPPDMRPGNVVAVFDAMLRAMAAGEITPEEARAITLVLDARNRVLEAWQRERSLAERERFAAGGLLYPKAPVFDWHPDDDDDMPEPPGFAAAWRQHEAEWAEYEASCAEIEARATAMQACKPADAPRAGASVPPANHLHPQGQQAAATGDDATGEDAPDPGDHLHSACISRSRTEPTATDAAHG
jgi:hypothetical protein